MNKTTVAAELKKRLENRNTQFLDLEMKYHNNESVTVDDIMYHNSGRIVVWYSKYQVSKTYDSLEAVAEALINYPADAKAVVAEEEAWEKENEPKVREMFHKYFEGKTWEEIKSNPDLYDLWGSYSDYHKDVFGYRPHAVVCGTYVSPY